MRSFNEQILTDTTTFRPEISTFQYTSESEDTHKEPSYFQTKRKYYDPFKFQSVKKKPQPISQYLENNPIRKDGDVFLNRLDSRFSIQVSNYAENLISKISKISIISKYPPGIELCQFEFSS